MREQALLRIAQDADVRLRHVDVVFLQHIFRIVVEKRFNRRLIAYFVATVLLEMKSWRRFRYLQTDWDILCFSLSLFALDAVAL